MERHLLPFIQIYLSNDFLHKNAKYGLFALMVDGGKMQSEQPIDCREQPEDVSVSLFNHLIKVHEDTL